MLSTKVWAGGLVLSAFIEMVLFIPISFAQEPTSTTATYDNWIVRCRTTKDKDKKTSKICEVIHIVSLKNKQTIAQIAIGQLPKAEVKKIVFQLPLQVWLRDEILLNLDGKQAFSASYVTCQPNSCLADVDLTDEQINMIKSAKTATLSFSDATRRKITLPISLRGFNDAYKATFGQ